MRILRRLSKHGNCYHVSIPNTVIDYMRWRGGDMLVLDVRDGRTVEIRLPQTAEDLRAPLPSLTIDRTLPEGA